jgi:hypothetical protein
MDDDPLILTLALDALTQQRFERERRQHFPAARNHIPAHVSMFQSLPGAELVAIVGRLEALRGRARLAVEVCGVRTLGRGCAYELRSAALDGLRAELARGWAGWLGAQDRQGYRPHVTVQNKVAMEVARDTLARLQAGFMPWTAQGVGVTLWRYLGGPWERLDHVEFAREPDGPAWGPPGA